MKKVMVDPPNGYLYGFPKAVPDKYVEEGIIVDHEGYLEWLAGEYPKEVVYLRTWVEEE